MEQEISCHGLCLVVYGVEHSVLSHSDTVSLYALEFLVILGTGVFLERLNSFPDLPSVFWRETLESLENSASDLEFIHRSVYPVDFRQANSVSTSAAE